MFYILLWLENAVFALFFAAWLLRFAAGTGRGFVKKTLLTFPIFIPLFFYGAMWVWSLSILFRNGSGFFEPILTSAAALVVYGVGLIFLWLRAFSAHPEKEEKYRGSLWPRFTLAFGLISSGIIHFGTLWGWDHSNQRLADSFREEALSLAKSVEPASVPDEENAALLYREAFANLRATKRIDDLEIPTQWNDIVKLDREQFDYQNPELKQFLREREAGLQLILRAARMPSVSFGHKYSPPELLKTHPIEVYLMRRAALLLSLDTRVRGTAGDIQGAIRNIDAIFRMSEHVCHEPTLNHNISGGMLSNMAIQDFQWIVRHAKPSNGDYELVHLPEEHFFQKQLLRALTMEEASMKYSLYQICSSSSAADEVADRIGLGTASKYHLNWLPKLFYRNCILKYEEELFQETISRARALLMTSNVDISSVVTALDQEDTRLKKWYGKPIVSFLLVPVSSNAASSTFVVEAKLEVIRTAMALLKCKADKGRLPQTLEELVPAYLLSQPIDPFDNLPLKYKLTDEGVTVYSIGQDRKDDAGILFRVYHGGDLPFFIPK